MSVVLVLTDGMPTKQKQTEEAADSLQKKARVLWLPTGNGAPMNMIEKLAAQPKEEHILKINNFKDLTYSGVINNILAGACPTLV